MKMHEHILIFGKSGAVYNPQMTYGEPYKRIRDRAYVEKNNHKYHIKNVHTVNCGERHPISVQYFPQKWRRQDQAHPAQKPVELIEWLIRSYSNEGDTVLDNTMGSGTTMVACVNTNRKGIGIELEKEYYDIAVKRVKDALSQPKLDL